MNRPEKYYNFTWDTIGHWAAVRPGADALLCVGAEQPVSETRLTFRELFRKACQAANFLNACQVVKGDRVVIMLPRISEWWIFILALELVGAVPVPATQLLTRGDLEFRVKSCKPKALITDKEGSEKASFFDGVKIQVEEALPGWICFKEEVKKARDQYSYVPTLADDPSILYFTSATNGQPKMVVHSHCSYAWSHRLTGGLWLDLRPEDLHWNISDLGWGKAAWSSLFGPWQMGATVFAMNFKKFQPVRILETFSQYKISTFCAPPTALRLLMKEDVRKYKFPCLRHCVSAGEPLTHEVVSNWKTGTGLNIYEGYGQTETVIQIANVRSRYHELRVGSMGKAMPGYDIHIVDDNQQPVKDGEEGEIAIRVDQERPVGLFTEYWGQPEMTRNAFKNGWYLTGDRAICDPEGYFWFTGRADDIIKSSDYRIGPTEVESTLLKHPAVLEAAVVGKPDATRCQLVKAFVVLHDGYANSSELAKDIQKHCRALSASYKLPREIEFVAELPKTTTGKVRRVELRELEKHRAAVTREMQCLQETQSPSSS